MRSEGLPNNIAAALESEIEAFLGLDRYGLSLRHKEACVRLCIEQPSLDGAALVRRLLDRIRLNRSTLMELGRSARGNEMWRWKKNVALSLANTSLEVRIERAIVRLLDESWTNQVPAASGLTEADEQRRSIDLVRRRSSDDYDFIELKALRSGKTSTGEQTPLFASMEVLTYGLLFVFCKANRDALFPSGIENRPLLNARRVHLEVLMTPNCYLHSTKRGLFHIGWLNRLLVCGLAELNQHQKRLKADNAVEFAFSFKQFSRNFEWTDEDHRLLLTEPNASPSWNTLKDRISEAVATRELAVLL